MSGLPPICTPLLVTELLRVGWVAPFCWDLRELSLTLSFALMFEMSTFR